MSDTERPECGRIARSTGKPCKRYAGQGTSHVGTGACDLHGAGKKEKPGGAPRGNKNALVTGEYETLYLSTLSEEERQLYLNMTITPREQAEHNLRLICIRIHRILIRINRVEMEDDGTGLQVSSMSTQAGWNIKGKVELTSVERTPILSTVMALEEAITRLQKTKISAIDQLRSALKDSGGGEDRLKSLVNAIDRSAESIARARAAEAT